MQKTMPKMIKIEIKILALTIAVSCEITDSKVTSFISFAFK